MAKQIPLNKRNFRGEYAIVDDADYDMLARYGWSRTKNNKGYPQAGSQGQTLLMHRLIMSPPDGMTVDHINGDVLDNRRCNLRICTTTQNSRSRPGQRGSTSEHKGVSWSERLGKWRARIHVDGQEVYLGLFEDQDEAARAYDRAALHHFGEYARLNLPDEAPLLSLSDADWMDEIRDAAQLPPDELADAIQGTPRRRGRAA